MGLSRHTHPGAATGLWSLSPAHVLSLIAAGGLLSLLQALQGGPGPITLGAPLIAHVTGMLAGYGVAIMLVLMSRSPALERGVGSDRLVRWHARGGRAFLLLAVVHVVTATMSWAQARKTSFVAGLWDELQLPGVLAATVGTALLMAVGVASARAARRRLPYEVWHAIHLTTYVAVAVTFSHQLAGPNMAGLRAWQVAWSLLYTYAFGLVLRHRMLTPLLQLWRHRMRIERITPEANGVVSIELTGHHLGELAAESGQFFRWRFLTTSTWTSAHPFSLSAPPSEDRLRVTVKALGDGSRRLHSLHPGTRVLAEGPYGAMTERRRLRHSVLLVAGGVGITPMRALFETMSSLGERLTLLYRVSSAEAVVFRDELDTIARRCGARVIYLIGSSSDPANSLTAESLSTLVPGLRHHDVYLCASPAMSAAVRTALNGTRLPKRQLHEEVFAF